MAARASEISRCQIEGKERAGSPTGGNIDRGPHSDNRPPDHISERAAVRQLGRERNRSGGDDRTDHEADDGKHNAHGNPRRRHCTPSRRIASAVCVPSRAVREKA